MTRKTVTNTFHGYLARKSYTARELPTHVSQLVLFSFKYIFARENPFDFAILLLLPQNGSKRETRGIFLMK